MNKSVSNEAKIPSELFTVEGCFIIHSPTSACGSSIRTVSVPRESWRASFRLRFLLRG